MKPNVRQLALLAALWAMMAAAGVWHRPLMPIDETRYASVAWEMRVTGNYLVPHLNGAVYPDKPPLLFWLINLAWTIFGVHESAARALGPAFGFIDCALAGALARTLWPEDAPVPRLASTALVAMPAFALYSSLLMFDALLTSFVLIGLMGIVNAARGQGPKGWGLIALGLGGAMLAKGPVAVIYLLPVALAAPWWRRGQVTSHSPYVRQTLAGLGLGIGLALAWAAPAAAFGGAEYREAILWKQTAGRMSHAFAHEHPIWFYLPFLPLMLFPWIEWPPLYRMIRRESRRDEGLRLCLVWLLSAAVALSLISGKQLHYLLPLMPALALIAARVCTRIENGPAYAYVPAGGFALLAGTVIAASFLMPEHSLVELRIGTVGIAAIVLIAAVCGAMVWRRRSPAWVFHGSAIACALLAVSIDAMAGQSLHAHQDTRAFGAALRRAQAEGSPLLHVGKYHGQFSFTGRLREPIAVAQTQDQADDWIQNHPDGLVVVYWRGESNPYGADTVFSAPFRGQIAGLVRARALTQSRAP